MNCCARVGKRRIATAVIVAEMAVVGLALLGCSSEPPRMLVTATQTALPTYTPLPAYTYEGRR